MGCDARRRVLVKTEAWIGLDVHKKSVTVALVAGRSEKELMVQKLPNSPGGLLKLMRKFERFS